MKKKDELVIGGGRINPCKAFPKGAVQVEAQRGLQHIIVTVGGVSEQLMDAVISVIQLGAAYRQSKPKARRTKR